MKRIIIFILLPLLLAISCTSDFSEIEIRDFNDIIITANKTVVNGLEIIQINIRNLVEPDAKYTATFGSETVEMVRANGSNYALMIPDLPTGTYTFQSDLALEQTISFSVTETTLTETAQKTVDDIVGISDGYLDKLVESTDSLVLLGLLPASERTVAKELKMSLENTLTKFRNASATEKTAAAKFLKANEIWVQEIKQAIQQLNQSIPDDLLSDRDFCSGDDVDQAECIFSALGDAVVIFTSGYLIAALSESGIGNVLGVAILLDMTLPSAMQFKNKIISAFNFAFIATGAVSFTNENGSDNYLAEEAYPVTIGIAKRNIQETDSDAGQQWMALVLVAQERFLRFWERLQSISEAVELPELDLPTARLVEKLTDALGNLRVEILDNDNLRAEIGGTPAKPTLTFFGNGAMETTFGFQIVYDDGVFQAQSDTLIARLLAPGMANYFVYNGKPFRIADGLIEDYGVASPLGSAISSFYNYDFSVSDGTFLPEMNGDDIDYELDAAQATFLFSVELFSPGISGFQDGTYQFLDENNATQTSISGKFFFFDAEVNLDGNSDGDLEDDADEISLSVTSGTVTVSSSGMNYTLAVDVTLSNGEKLVGNYTGIFKYDDER